VPIPELIEIVPLTAPIQAVITVPGSKSITNRALILAALADGETTLHGALWSEDTQVMVDCLHRLGFTAEVQPDPDEVCNRTITVKGLGGKIPHAGTAEKPLDLFVGNAGTAARFVAAMVCLGNGCYRLSGIPRMHERPQAALFGALRELGYRVDSEKGNDKLPVIIHGASPGAGSRHEEALTNRKCRVSIEQSSQFASALILSAKVGGWQIEITGENADESPYVVMTSELCKVFPPKGGTFQIEPDASSGSYFWAARFLHPVMSWNEIRDTALEMATSLTKMQAGDSNLEQLKTQINQLRSGFLGVSNWPKSHWQIDENFPRLLIQSSASTEGAYFHLPATISRVHQLGDSIMTAVILAPFANRPIRFTELSRLRVQECERVVALRTELTRCGAEVLEHGDTLTVSPSTPRLHGAEIETYHDHRMAMCFAILGLKVPGIKIINPACVKKTFPNFFQKLATPPPHGLGVEIRDGRTGRRLELNELFAD
jgi:3-phosphoshikimate 1-carboxyvinyltransferase